MKKKILLLAVICVVFFNNVFGQTITGGSVCAGGTFTISSTGGGTWSSNATSIATVSSSGVVTGVAHGQAIISYTLSGVTDTALVTVNQKPTPSASVSLPTICAGISDIFTGGNTCSANALSFASSSFSWSTSVVSAAVDNITVEAWVKWTGTASHDQYIFYNGNGGSGGYGLYVKSGTYNLGILCGGVAFLTSTASLAAGTWQHVALVRSSGTWSVYVNEVAYSVSPATVTPATPAGHFWIGSGSDSANNFNGVIDNPMFWIIARNAAQLSMDGSACSIPAQAGLQGYWPFEEGSGATTTDASGHGNTLTLGAGASWTSSVFPVTASYSWAFGDGATSTNNVVSHAYSTSGTYTPGFTVTYSSGCAATVTSSVNVGVMVSGITASATSLRINNSLTLTAGSVTNGGTSPTYTWSGPNSYFATTTTPSVSFTPTTTAASGIYSLTVTNTTTGCSSGTAVITPYVTVFSLPVITSLSATSGYAPSSITINGSNFDPTAANDIVYFGAMRATVSAASSTALTVTLPTGSTYGPVSVFNSTAGLIGSSPFPFLPGYNNSGYLTDRMSFNTKVNFTTGAHPFNTAISDLDGDGKPDMVVSNSNDNTISVFRNTGSSGSITASSFAAKVDLDAGGYPACIAIGDINGDGKPDIAIADETTHRMSVILNNSTSGSITSASFASRVSFLEAGGQTHGLVLADIDGDGKLDVITAESEGTNIIAVFRNTSSTTTVSFAPRIDIVVGQNAPNCVIAGDVDGDGKPDLVIGSGEESKVGILRNTSSIGSISFAGVMTIATGSISPGVALCDVDGDGKRDIINANMLSGNIAVWRNTSSSGSPSFASAVNFTTGSYPSYIGVGDFNGDGKPDLAVTNYMSATVSVFRNTATSGSITSASFAAGAEYSVGGSPYCVMISDLDGDGKPDMAVSNSTGNTISVIRNNPLSPIAGVVSICPGATCTLTDSATNGTWTSGNTSVATIDNTTGIMTGVSGGTVVITYTAGGSSVTATATILARPSISGVTASTTTICIGATITLAAGTITNGGAAPSYAWTGPAGYSATGISGIDTLTILSAAAGGIYSLVVTNTVNGCISLPAVSSALTMPPPPVITSLSALTGNPATAITISGSNFNTTIANNIVYFGATRATVSTATATSLAVTVPAGATYFPVSVDNLTCGFTGYAQNAFLPKYNNSAYVAATENLSTRVNFSTGSLPQNSAVGDVDGDGKPDLVVVNELAGTVSVYRNTSSSGSITAGSFAAKVDFTTGSTPSYVAIGDINGDGKPDIVTANTNASGTVSVLQNIASSGSITSTSFAAKVDFATGSNPISLAIGDIDGDGKPDIAIANSTPGTVSVLRNVSATANITASSFVAKVDFTTDNAPQNIVISDIDGDGKPDIVTANNNASGTISVLRNTSSSGSITSGSLAAKVSFTTGAYPQNVAVSDIDGDGKPDVITANNNTSGTVSLLRNTSSSGSITSGSFAVKVDFTVGSNPVNVSLGDIDGDGKPDIGVTNNSANTISILRNTSSSGSITASSLAARVDFATGSAPLGLAISDIDGDGKPDMIVTNTSDNTISVLRNNPLSPITGTTTICTTNTLSETVTGGTWTSSDTTKARVNSTTGLITAVAVGTATITYAGGATVVSNANIATTTVTINALPTVSGVAASATSLCAGGSFTLTAGSVTGSSLPVHYKWTGPNGYNITDTLVSESLTPTTTAAGGVYSLSIVNSGAGCTSSAATIPITVNAKPTVSAVTGSSTEVCIGGTLTLTAGTVTGTGSLTSYNWSGPGSYSTTTAANSTATIPTVGGIYSLYVTYPGSGCTSVVRTTSAIAENALPMVAGIGRSSSVICMGTSLTLTSFAKTGSGTFISYNWSGPNSYAATGTVTTATLTPTTTAASGNYSLTVTYSGTGCTSHEVVTSVTVNARPTIASITPSTTTLCTGTTLTLTAGTVTGTGTLTSYNWSGPNSYGATSTITAIALTPTTTTASGNYSLTVTYAGAGCTSAAAVTSPSVTVNVKPTLVGITPSPNTLCTGAPLTLTAGTVTGIGTLISYNWSGPNGYSAAGTGITTTLTPTTTAASGNYSLSVTYPGTGCTSVVRTASVTVNPLPTISGIIPSVTNACIGTPLTFTAGSRTGTGAFTSYNWSGPNGYSSSGAATSVALTPTTTAATGNYSLSVTYAGTGCTSAVAVTPLVNVVVIPVLGELAGLSSVCPDHAILLTDTVAGGTWSNTTGNATVSSGVVTGVTQGGDDTIKYSVTNVCGTTTVAKPVHINQLGIWQGSTTGANSWNDTLNWPCSRIPDNTVDVIIPASVAYQPQIVSFGTGTLKNITLQSGASLVLGSGSTLNVKGTLINDGNITGAGITSLNGSTAQILSGIGSISNLDVNNTSGVTIATAARATIGTVLSITSGSLATNDSLVLGSDSSGTARIAQITAGSITGKVQTRQWIAGGHRAFRFWGHPFTTDIPLSQMQQFVDITGSGGAGNGFTPSVTNAPSCYRYNPLVGNSSMGYDPGWKPFTSAMTTTDTNGFQRYEGIRLFVRGAKGHGLDGLPYTPAPVTIGMSGPVNQGPLTIHLKKGTSDLQDYNQVANPYPSPVDIGTIAYHAWQHGNINGSAIYVWDPYLGVNGQFIAVPVTSGTPYYLQAYTSFQVRAMHNNDSLNFTESNKVSYLSNTLLRTAADHLLLTVYDDNYQPWDKLTIAFNDGATEAEDNYDAKKPGGPAALNFYSLSADNKKMVIDARPSYKEQTIPLGINSSYAQDFIIKATGTVAINNNLLYLHDKLLKQYTLLTEGMEYHFAITADKTTQGDNRFELTTESRVPIAAATNLQVNMYPNPATDEVTVSFTNGKADKVSIRVTDISGISVYSKDMSTQQSEKLNINLSDLAAGIYMVELRSGNEKVVQKLVKE